MEARRRNADAGQEGAGRQVGTADRVRIGTIRLRGTTPELDLAPLAGFVYYTMENYPGLIPDGAIARVP